jgi:hypothetical protein
MVHFHLLIQVKDLQVTKTAPADKTKTPYRNRTKAPGGVVKDEPEAAGYFKLAPDQNHASAQFHSAFCLEDG